MSYLFSKPPITVYNSITHSNKTKNEKEWQKNFKDSDDHFNGIYFKHLPEWRVSNIGEKIIGSRNIIKKWWDGKSNLILNIWQTSYKQFNLF